jgi:hypothetical protein
MESPWRVRLGLLSSLSPPAEAVFLGFTPDQRSCAGGYWHPIAANQYLTPPEQTYLPRVRAEISQRIGEAPLLPPHWPSPHKKPRVAP